MQSEKSIFQILLLILYSALLVVLVSFTKSYEKLDAYKFEISPVNISITYNPGVVYTPEFSMNVDSVEIPLKRAGRLLLIEARVGNQTGNLVFDTGANGMVLNSTYFRDYVRSGGSNPGGVTGDVGFVEQITTGKIASNWRV